MPQSNIFSSLNESAVRNTEPTLYILLTLSRTTTRGVFAAALNCGTSILFSSVTFNFLIHLQNQPNGGKLGGKPVEMLFTRLNSFNCFQGFDVALLTSRRQIHCVSTRFSTVFHTLLFSFYFAAFQFNAKLLFFISGSFPQFPQRIIIIILFL